MKPMAGRKRFRLFRCGVLHRIPGRLLLIGLALLLLPGPVSVHGQEEAFREYEIKAAMLYKFTRFAEWPEESFEDEQSPFNIGILGSDPYGDLLDKLLADKTIQEHPARIHRSRKAADLTHCHLVYIADSENQRLESHLPILQRRGILTLGESSYFTRKGGCIAFVVSEDRRINFEINQNAARAAELKISAQLLQLAKRVYNGKTARETEEEKS
jgi:hypothetical protein